MIEASEWEKHKNSSEDKNSMNIMLFSWVAMGESKMGGWVEGAKVLFLFFPSDKLFSRYMG